MILLRLHKYRYVQVTVIIFLKILMVSSLLLVEICVAAHDDEFLLQT